VELVFGFNPLAVNGRAASSEIPKSGKLYRISGIFLQKIRFGPLGCVGLPVLPCFPTPLVSGYF
jgi:hypothetical protein